MTRTEFPGATPPSGRCDSRLTAETVREWVDYCKQQLPVGTKGTTHTHPDGPQPEGA